MQQVFFKRQKIKIYISSKFIKYKKEIYFCILINYIVYIYLT